MVQISGGVSMSDKDKPKDQSLKAPPSYFVATVKVKKRNGQARAKGPKASSDRDQNLKPESIEWFKNGIIQTLSDPLGARLNMKQVSQKLRGGSYDEGFRGKLQKSAPSNLVRDAKIVWLAEISDGGHLYCLWEYATNEERKASLEQEVKAANGKQINLTPRAKAQLRMLRKLLNPE